MRRTPPTALAVLGAAALTVAVTTVTPAGASSPAPTSGVVARAATAVPADLTLVQTRTSLLGEHRWYAQTYRGIPVLDGWYAVHTGTSTTVEDGRRSVAGLPSLKAGLTRDAAVGAAKAKGHGQARAARLAIVAAHGDVPATLVWEVSTAEDKRVLVRADKGGVLKVIDERRHADGTGKVFDPNPVVSQQNQALKDNNDAASAVPTAAYKTVTLANLDTSGYLRGTWARVVNKTSGKQPAAYSSTRTFSYTRDDDRFEQVNAYYAVDRLQTYLRGLGFTDVNAEAQDLNVNGTTADNSWYTPSTDVITIGTGGVDDGEDQEVVWHEYGHAVQDDQVPGFGSSTEAGAIGEGFGDYLAATLSQANSPDSATTPWACVMDWDSTSYTSTTPHCIRRLDTSKTVADRTGEVHDDGEIWSRALWDVNKAFGRDKATKIIVEAQFSFAPNTTWAAAANTTVATANALYGATDAATVKAAFQARGIL